MKKVISLLKDPKILFKILVKKGYLRWIPDEPYLKLAYFIKLNKKLNLKTPSSFNEKIQWLKLNDRKAEYTNLVDKFEVRNYIAKIIGEKHLIPLLGIYENFNDINFKELPNQFVLKSTHDSGGVVICKDKQKFNIEEASLIINKSLSKNYYDVWREWPYKDVKPRIICEMYMEETKGEEELKDYKFMCFNGQVRCSFVALNRQSATGLNIDFYDREWNLMPFERHYPTSGTKIRKPSKYNEMIKYAELLSGNIPFLRVDFYEVDGKLYFGELTFYPGSGFEEFTPEKYDYLLGNWIDLP